MAEAEAVHRPIGVAIVAVLAGLSGVVDVITGILLMFEGSNPEVADALGGSGGVLWASIGSILLGVVVLALSFGIWLGRWVARMIVTVLAGAVAHPVALPRGRLPRQPRRRVGERPRVGDRADPALDAPGERVLPCQRGRLGLASQQVRRVLAAPT